MTDIAPLIDEILNRRFLEIAICKRNILLARTDEQKKALMKASVLIIYSSTEGGTKELVRVLVDYINRSSVDVLELSPTYLELAMNKACQLKNAILDYDKMIKTTSDIKNTIMGKTKLPGTVDLESNITPKVIFRLCKALCLNYFMNNEQESMLNILLRFRNNIAHGDMDMMIEQERIDAFSGISQYILCQLANEINEVYINKKWLVV